MKKAKRVLTLTLVVLLLMLGLTGGAGAYYISSILGKVNRPDSASANNGDVDPDYIINPDNPDDMGIVEKPTIETNDDIFNVLLYGVDKAKGEKGRSDVICVCSINKTKGSITLISVLRDTLVSIPGHGDEKITHAFSYGGPKLAIQTFNSNFHTDITDYAVVNFNSMENLIDAVGGLNITVTKSEMSYVNRGVREVNRDNGRSSSSGALDHYGEDILLTGRQAVAYARIRKIGNDYERTNRQRTVLDALLKKLLGQIKQNPLSAASILDTLLPMVTTSLSNQEILDIATSLVLTSNNEILQDRIPADGEFTTGMKNGSWVVTPEMEKLRQRLHAHLYKGEEARNALQPTGTPSPDEDVPDTDE